MNVKYFELLDWKEIDTIVFLCSTAGDGDRPQVAKDFFEFLANTPPDLSHCDYSVLAFGDSAYPNYCAAGLRLEEFLDNCSANSIKDLQKVNSENKNTINEWLNELSESL